MKLKLACSDYSFARPPLEAVLDLIKALKFPFVDIGLFEGGGHLFPSKELVRPERSGTRLRHMLGDRGLKVADVFLIAASNRHQLTPGHRSAADRRKSRDLFERGLDYLKAAGGSHMSQIPGVNRAGETAEKSFERSASELEWRLHRAKELGVVYAVEPHLESIIESPAAALRLVKRVPGLTFALDYSHFTMAGYSDAEIQPLLKYASNIHVRGARKGRLQAPFRHNTIDFGRILRVLNAQSYRGHLALEYVCIEWENCNECDTVSETILFRDYLTSVAKEL